MHRVLILGAGKIGSLISVLLSQEKEYDVHLCDHQAQCLPLINELQKTNNIHFARIDAENTHDIEAYINKQKIGTLISALPYYCNPAIAQLARTHNLHYFDLTEDVEVTEKVKQLSEGASSVFVPQCGLAPGFISIAAHDLISHFDTLDTVKMRVGALPSNPNNTLKYSLTWSTDGLINEYGNPCYAIIDDELAAVQPLEGLETITVDGLLYEAFNTSGGIGTLAETYQGKARNMNYKTLRYPGHCEKIRFLMNELKLNDARDTLKTILENAVPKTMQDVVLVYVSVSGIQHGEFYEENYVQKIYPKHISGQLWSAIQITTASGICSVVDIILSSPQDYHGFIKQEQFSLAQILENRIGQNYSNQ